MGQLFQTGRFISPYWFIVVTWLSMGVVVGEFRFCYRGPQKFQNKDCPYGVFIPRAIRSPCVYYVNDQTGPSGEAELQTCGKTPDSLSGGGERMEDVKFQGLFLDIADPNENGELGQLDRRDCEDECLKLYKPPEEASGRIWGEDDPEEPGYDEMVTGLLSDETLSAQKNLTADLFLSLLEEETEPELTYLRSAQLLRQSMKIMATICSPYVSSEFLDQVYRGFLYLVLKSNDTIQDVGILEARVIEDALKKCHGLTKPQIEGVVCNDYSKITGFNDKRGQLHKYVREAKSFRWGKYDPFVEAAWAPIDFVHGFCYPVHSSNFNYHHIYEAALEPLFTRTIMQRWPNPPTLSRGVGYWNNLLNVKDAQLQMRNLDACVQAVYGDSIYKERLNRPFSKFPKLNGIQSNGASAPPSSSGTGWTQGIDQYWAMYKQNYGFQHFLESVGGTCIKTEDALNTIRGQMSEHACKS